MTDEKPRKRKKRKKVNISVEERKKRSDRLRKTNQERLQKLADEKIILKKEMPVKHKLFCDLYTNSESKTFGKQTKSYVQVFGKDSRASQKAMALLKQEHIVEYINKQREDFDFLCQAEKYQNIKTMAKIRDEMSDAKYVNRFGEINGVAACRSVSLKAASEINKMLGFDKPKEVNINHNNENMGVTINVIAPPTPENQKKINGGTIDIECEEVK